MSKTLRSSCVENSDNSLDRGNWENLRWEAETWTFALKYFLKEGFLKNTIHVNVRWLGWLFCNSRRFTRLWSATSAINEFIRKVPVHAVLFLINRLYEKWRIKYCYCWYSKKFFSTISTESSLLPFKKPKAYGNEVAYKIIKKLF